MRDPKVEALLEREGIPWEYVPFIPFTEVDIEASKANQARTQARPLDPVIVYQYWVAMSIDGDEFPALVGYRNRSSKIVLNGGNHRTAAHLESDHVGTDFYILHTTDQEMLDYITRKLNDLEGNRSAPDERMSHAVQMIRQWNWTVKRAADKFGLKEVQIEAELRRRRHRGRLLEVGIDPKSIPVSHAERLATLRNDPVLVAAHKTTAKSGLTLTQLDELMGLLRAARSESEQLSANKAFYDRPDIAKQRAARKSGRQRASSLHVSHAFRALNTLDRLFERYPTRQEMQITSDEDLRKLESVWASLDAKVRRFMAQNRPQVAAGR
jgi:hypothetical protein